MWLYFGERVIWDWGWICYFLCRDGKQIDFLSINEKYNFEMQQITNLGNIKTIKQVSPHYLLGLILSPYVQDCIDGKLLLAWAIKMILHHITVPYNV